MSTDKYACVTFKKETALGPYIGDDNKVIVKVTSVIRTGERATVVAIE
jgi:hypothetical protein